MLRRLVLSPIIASAILAAGFHGATPASAAADAATPVDRAAETTMELAQRAISFSVQATGDGAVPYRRDISVSSSRYDEIVTLDNGAVGRLGAEGTRGYVMASLIPLPREVLTEARLGPSSVVGFTFGVTPIGKLGRQAALPGLQQDKYLAYSPAGMWLRVRAQVDAGEVEIGFVSTRALSGGATRYEVEVTQRGDASNGYTVTADVAADGTLTAMEVDAGEAYAYTITTQDLGDAVTFPAKPTSLRPWSEIQAAQWRLATQPRATTAGRETKQRVENNARTQAGPITVAGVRAAATAVAARTKAPGATVRAWNIAGGSRIEIVRKGSSGWRWTVGTCITVTQGRITSAAR